MGRLIKRRMFSKELANKKKEKSQKEQERNDKL